MQQNERVSHEKIQLHIFWITLVPLDLNVRCTWTNNVASPVRRTVTHKSAPAQAHRPPVPNDGTVPAAAAPMYLPPPPPSSNTDIDVPPEVRRKLERMSLRASPDALVTFAIYWCLGYTWHCVNPIHKASSRTMQSPKFCWQSVLWWISSGGIGSKSVQLCVHSHCVILASHRDLSLNHSCSHNSSHQLLLTRFADRHNISQRQYAIDTEV